MRRRKPFSFLITAFLVSLDYTSYGQVTMTYDIATQCPQLAWRVHLFGTIAAGSGPEAAILDWNHDGKMDVILTRTNVTPNRTDIYEFDGIDSLGMARFNIVYTFPVYFSASCSEIPCPPVVVAFGEFTDNGLIGLACWSPGDTLRVYEQADSTSLPTRLRFSIWFRTNYVTQGEIKDFNANGSNEFLVNHRNSHTLYRYQQIDSSFMLVWRDSVHGAGNDTYNGGRYAVGDFDADGQLEFAGGNSYPGGSYDAFVFVYKKTGLDQFALAWSDTLQGVIDLWAHGSGGDLDGNGKAEFWVGGYTYADRTLYKFFMYEAVGDRMYDSLFVLTVRLPYLGTASVGEIAFGDVDGDGKNEIALSTGDYVLILRPKGPRNFEPIACIPSGTSDSEVWLKDIDRDGRAEIIISRVFYGPRQTWFYKYVGSTAMPEDEHQHPLLLELKQNYPNPFNFSTIISFGLPSKSFVSLKVFDALGRQVARLLSEELPAGEYSQQWDVTDLTSGVYFYRLQAGSFTETKKLILLR